MVISDYRVQSVLRTYGKQLQRSKLANRLGAGENKSPAAETVTISEEAKRRLIMERVTSQASEQAMNRQEELNDTSDISGEP
jgi:phage gp16-like protein